MIRPLGTILAALAVLAAGCAAPSTPDGPPGSPPPTAGPTVPGPEARGARIATADGLTLDGLVFGGGPVWVVLAHMRPASKESWEPFAGVLAARGYTALVFDFRGYGASEGSGFAVDVDVLGAVDYAVTSGASAVAVIGASMGGTGAVAAAARRELLGVVTLSAPARFEGVDAVAAAGGVAEPMLLVAGEGDDGYVDQAREIAAATTGPAEVVPLPGSRHGTDLFTDHAATLTDLLVGFLDDLASG